MASKKASAARAAPRRTQAGLHPERPVEVLGLNVLRTDRLLLRELRPGDRDEFIGVVRDSREHLAEFSPLHMPGESDAELFARQLRLTAAGERGQRACRRAAFDCEGRLVGAVNLNSIRRGLEFEADVNWWIAAGAARRGYATEALGAVLAHAFADIPQGLGLHRVLAGIQPQNEASRRLAERVGFRPMGPERSYLHAGGKWDLHEMHVISPESFARRAG